jgi:hypothetical protein
METAKHRLTLLPGATRVMVALVTLAAAGMMAGCAPAALRSARTKIEAGHYMEARQDLLRLRAKPAELSADQRREVKDDLCMTGFMIGPPTLSLHKLREACVDAVTEPGSNSASYLARINQAICASDDAAVEHALGVGDLASAETAATDYAATPGADPAKIAQWSHRMWLMVDAKQSRPVRAKQQERELARAIAKLRGQNRQIRAMSDSEFHGWILRTVTVGGQPIAVEPRFHAGVLRLTVPADALHTAALNLDRFAKINDAAIARCNCNARTNVGIGPGAFPAYVARLDAEEQRSEVLILLSGRSIGPQVSMR